MDQNYYEAPNRQPAAGHKKKKGHPILRFIGKFIGWTFLIVFTICVIGVLTIGIFAKIFMTYVDTTLIPSLGEVTAEEMSLALASTIYDRNGNVILTLYDNSGDTGGNRELVTYDQIPKHVIDALVAIEDHRFWEHNGVDWVGTAASIRDTLLYGNTRGGSTITQQLLRKMYDDTDVTVRRKFREICRALEYEKSVSKKDIITDYLNTVYFGAGCYGIQTAAKTYFGKDVSELTVAEGAAIVGITNYPYMYDPFRSLKFESGKTCRDLNKDRQEIILEQMCVYGYITESERDKYKKEKLLFTDTDEYKALHGIEPPEETEEETVDLSKIYTWFEDEAINEARDSLCEKYGYAPDYAMKLLYQGGYHIYTTLNPELQAIVDSVYQDLSNFDIPSSKGTQINSAITVVDPYTGEVVAIAGDVGVKTVNRAKSLATSPRQPGSSIKPVSVYAPALDFGLVTPVTIIDDYPLNNTMREAGFPRNANGRYRGLRTVTDGVQNSVNTMACRVLQMVTYARSYEFMENNLGFDLVPSDIDLSPLAMGGLTYGVTTMEMAAAYSAFVNHGIYTVPHLITRIENNDHTETLIDNTTPTSWAAMDESTAYLMNKMLRAVVTSGTGTSAAFDGMTIAGKTGSTQDNCDRYFTGYTPYYSAAVWLGYKDRPEKINYNGSGNPAAVIWKKVMSRIHEGLEDQSFFEAPAGITTATLCGYCGKKACSQCTKTVSGEIQASASLGNCSCHVEARLCTNPETEEVFLANEYCPEDTVTTVQMFSGRQYLDGIYAEDNDVHYSYLLSKGSCPYHDENYVPDPMLPDGEGDSLLPGDPDYEWPEYNPNGVPGWTNPQPWTEPGAATTEPEPDNPSLNDPADNPEPDVGNTEPVADNPEPVADDPEPAAVDPGPVIAADSELPDEPDEPQLPDDI